jgi:hypothetical protein
MRIMLGSGLVVAAALIGCSNDEKIASQSAMGGGPTGVGGAQAGAAQPPAGGAAGRASVPVGGNASVVRGDVLHFVPGTGEVPYAIGANSYGIQGGGFLARSPNGNTITVGTDPDQICIHGNLEQVPNGDYSGYWGVEIGFNLNQGPLGSGGQGGAGGGGMAGAGGAGGGGGAAGTPQVAQPWMPGNVVGFSFAIEGPTINLVRFKALPAGLDPTLESSVYCKSMLPVSGAVDDVLFTQMIQYCWNASGALLPIANGLANVSWQLPADVGVGARPFDWCLRDLRPILAG